MRQSRFGLQKPSPNPAYRKVPVSFTLGLTKYTRFQPMKRFLTHGFCWCQSSSTLRHGLEVCSLFALRAAAQSANPDQSVAAQSAASRGSNDPIDIKGSSIGAAADMNNIPNSKAQFHSPFGASCALSDLQLRSAPNLAAMRCTFTKVRPNRALNRTLCSGPILGPKA